MPEQMAEHGPAYMAAALKRAEDNIKRLQGENAPVVAGRVLPEHVGVGMLAPNRSGNLPRLAHCRINTSRNPPQRFSENILDIPRIGGTIPISRFTGFGNHHMAFNKNECGAGLVPFGAMLRPEPGLDTSPRRARSVAKMQDGLGKGNRT